MSFLLAPDVSGTAERDLGGKDVSGVTVDGFSGSPEAIRACAESQPNPAVFAVFPASLENFAAKTGVLRLKSCVNVTFRHA